MRMLPISALCLLLLFSVPGASAAAGLFGSKEAPFECAFEKDHNPPLDEASEAHKLYLQARELENAKLLRLPSEEKKIADLYIADGLGRATDISIQGRKCPFKFLPFSLRGPVHPGVHGA